MGILDGKRILVAGVTMDSSIGFATAKVAQEQGATVLISNFGRALGITRRIAKRLPAEPAVLELDVTDAEHLERLPDLVREHVDGLDGVVHSIAYGNPETLLGGKFLGWPLARRRAGGAGLGVLPDVAGRGVPPADGAGLLGRRPDLRRDASPGRPTTGWAWPRPASSRASRYLARDLGPERHPGQPGLGRSAADPGRQGDPGLRGPRGLWSDRAPLGWDNTDHEPTAQAVCALLSDFFPATTGEIIHVDGGFHAMGA